MAKILITFLVVQALAVVVLSPFPTSPASVQTEVALLTQPEGTVRVKRGQRTLTATDGMLLEVGDVVRVQGDGAAVIYQAYVSVTRLAANQNFNVTRRLPPPPERTLTTAEFTSFKVQYAVANRNRSNRSPVTMGGPENADLTLLEPRSSVVLTRRPIFRWSRVPDATTYLVNIYDKNESLVCAESTPETRLSPPGRCQPLEPGDYKWEVTARMGGRVSGNPAFYDATSFTVVTEQQATEIDKAVEHAREMAEGAHEAAPIYVSTLMESKIYPLAEAELLVALERSPRDQTLWALLIETYAHMKRWYAREKAREISVGIPTAELIRSLAVAR